MNIHYISPYRIDKNFGKGINEAIEWLNPADEDFICHVDQDALWLRPDSKKQLEEILLTTDFDILGPVTNRLAMPTQLASNMFDETDMKVHLATADLLHEHFYGDVYAVREVLAAFCLCFRVSTWKQLGGFVENDLRFDWLFSNAALGHGMKLGLMRGIYVFHLYRLNSANPRKDIAHLLP